MSEDNPVMARPNKWGPRDSMNSLLPVAGFLIFNSLFGLPQAIIATTVGSLYAMWDRNRRGIGVGVFIPVVAAVLIIRAVIGIVYDSDDVYFGSGVAVKFLMVIGLIVSVVVKRNIVGWGLPFGLPLRKAVTEHPIYQYTTARITLVWAAYLFLSGIFDIWLLRGSSANQFVVIRFLATWPFSTATTLGALLWANKKLNEIPGFEGLLPLVEEQYGGQTAKGS